MLNWLQDKIVKGRTRLFNVVSRPVTDRSSMLVSDTNIFSGDLVKLCVVFVEGGVWRVDVNPETSVEKLKTMAICHFCNPLDSIKLANNFKLVLVSAGYRPLHGECSLREEGLTENDELLLIEGCQYSNKKQPTEEEMNAPTVEEVASATCSLQPKNIRKQRPQTECSIDLESGIRRVLISLVEASARLLTPSPDSDAVFQIIRERLENKGVDHIVKQLTDLGYEKSLVVEALHLNSMNPRLALDWLTKHTNPKNKAPQDSQASSSRGVQQQGSTSPKSQHKERKPVIQSVASLLDSFRNFKRQYFKPNMKAVEKLKEMGFAEEDIVDALQVTGNHESSACEWLLGERRKSLEDLDVGLDPEGPIYKAIMNNPTIQLSLTNPKMLLAFLSMLENPNNTNVWINDPDAAPVLSQIFKTYHTEKHVQMTNYELEDEEQDQVR